jgi:DnaK suppressor protein
MAQNKLSKIELNAIEDRLKTLHQSVEQSLSMARENAATVILDQSSVGRISRMDAMQQQAMASVQRERMLIQQRRLSAAIQRKEAGTLGMCCQCELTIPMDRLLNDPATPFCADCQEEIDERRREASL